MGKQSRDKGARGETTASHLLGDAGFSILADMTDGKRSADFLVQDPQERQFAVEVKNCLVWPWSQFYKQSRENAHGKTRWMLMLHIPKTSSWLVLRQGERPVVWHERK